MFVGIYCNDCYNEDSKNSQLSIDTSDNSHEFGDAYTVERAPLKSRDLVCAKHPEKLMFRVIIDRD